MKHETSLEGVKLSSQAVPSMSWLGKSGDRKKPHLPSDGIALLLCSKQYFGFWASAALSIVNLF